jgi:TRAP-type C4-dicarboxylate transport system permease small subunit
MTHRYEVIEGAKGPPVADTGGLIDRTLDRVNSVIVMLSAVALLAASVVLTYSVFSRYFFHFSTDWQDELSVFLIVGSVFMSAAAIQKTRGHVAIEAVVTLMSPRANHIRQIIVDMASFLFCAFFSWKSWVLLEEAIVENYHSGSTWGPPLWIPYSLMTAGMVLLSIQLLLQVISQLRRQPK